MYSAFIQAGVEAGYLRTSDLNGYQQDGFGQCDMSIGNQRRWSTAKGYLHSLGRRDNLKVVLRAHVTHVEVEGNRVGGVVYQLDGHDVVAKASREVVISAGAINPPQILKLSGIGPGAELQSLGIVVKNERPGVGENLTDHTGVRISHECLAPVSLHPKLTLVGKAIIGMQWLMFKTGLGGSNQLEASAFIRSRSGLQWPDLQLNFTPLALSESDELEPVRHGF
jgi:choline dehydrogenase